jgi:HEAT repeat protein
MDWPRVLESLSTDEFYHSALFGLAGLDAEKLDQFATRWAELEPSRRQEAVEGMVEIAEEHPELNFGPVFRFLAKDPSPEVRAAAAGGLWECMESQDIDILLNMAGSDQAPLVRAAAAGTLGHAVYMVELLEIEGQRAQQIVQFLLNACANDPDFDVRRRALESLSFLSESPVPDMIEAAYQSENERMKVSALFCMGRNGSERWLPIVLKELSSDEPEMRFEAVRSAGELEDEELVWPVARLITDDDPEVRLQAVDSLGKMGGELAERTLEGLTESGDDAMRDAAADALEYLQAYTDPVHMLLNLGVLDDDEEDDE